VVDNSIQAVLVDAFAAPAEAFVLAYGGADSEPPAMPAGETLQVEQTAEVIRVDTGAMQFAVDRRNGRLFRSLVVGRELIAPETLQGPWAGDAVNGLFWSTAAGITEVRVEESGPIRCAVVLKGQHMSDAGLPLFRFDIRLHAYAGRPYLRIEHTFYNDQGPYSTPMTGLGVRLAFQPGLFTEMRAGEVTAKVGSGDTAYALDDRLWVWRGDETEEHASRAGGLAVLRGAEIACTAAIREWGLLGQKEFCFDTTRGFDLCIWPRHRTRGFVVPRGVSRSHRLWLYFHAPAANGAALRPLFFGHARLEAAPSAYCDSSVFGRLPERDADRFPRYEAMLGRYGTTEHGGFPPPGERRWIGQMLTYGDDRGDMGWGNMETMLDHCMALLYVRSLDPWYYEKFVAAVQHYRDVDLCHPWGQSRVHCHNHTLYPWDNSHAWIKGIIDHYVLTGDRRSLDVIAEHGRWLLSVPLDYEIERGTRRFTRTLQNLADIYRLTGHDAYRENFAARIDIAERLRQGHEQVSRFRLGDHYRKKEGEPTVASYGRMGFVQAYGVSALMTMAKATGDPRWRDAFTDEMRFVLGHREEARPLQTLEEMRQWGETLGGRYNSGRDAVVIECVQYLHDRTGDDSVADAATYAAVHMSANTKWRDQYANHAYSGVAFSAFGMFGPAQAGRGPELEEKILGVVTQLPAVFRDPGFEREEGMGWAGGKERMAAQMTYQVTFNRDTEMRLEGEASMRIEEAAYSVDKYTWRLKRAQRGAPIEVNEALLAEEPGSYELIGFTRVRGDARPDVDVRVDGRSSDARRTIPLALPPRMPKLKYQEMMDAADGDLGEGAMTIGQETGDADVPETLAEEPDRPADPLDGWWRFRVVFTVTESSAIDVAIRYIFPPLPGGSVWYDDFRLRRLDAAAEETIEFAPLPPPK
jgi:hypothetical protein